MAMPQLTTPVGSDLHSVGANGSSKNLRTGDNRIDTTSITIKLTRTTMTIARKILRKVSCVTVAPSALRVGVSLLRES